MRPVGKGCGDLTLGGFLFSIGMVAWLFLAAHLAESGTVPWFVSIVSLIIFGLIAIMVHTVWEHRKSSTNREPGEG